jgi:DNA-binding XRE family transcriptional regulator
MPTRKLSGRREDETDEQYSARLQRRAEFVHQIAEEIRYAAAGQGMSLAEVSRRLGDPTGRTVGSNRVSLSLARLADISLAMGVTFRLVAVPDTNAVVTRNGSRPRSDRRFTPDEVREIRRQAKAGKSQRQLAQELGVAKSSIAGIVRGKNYADVE